MSGSISRVFILIALLVVFQCSKALPNTGLFQSTKDEDNPKEESVYAEVPTNVDGINDFDEHGRTYLIDAALAGDADAIANYIKAGALVDVTTSDGNTALLLAAKNGLYLACMELINHGANLEHKNALGISPLLISVIMGHKLLVQSMLDHNADPNVALPDGTSALMLAAQKGRDEIIHLLLNKGANINAQSIPGTTPLMFACMSHQLSTVQAVLSAHPALEKKESREGLSALSYAAARGMSDIILELLKAGADIESKDDFGRTPIEVAIFKRQQSAIDTLAICGAHLPKKGFRLSKETLDARSKYMEEKARTKPHVQYYGREIKVDRKGS